MRFEDFFNSAMKCTPYPFQISLANDRTLPDMIHVPTGLGKTSIILIWLWRRLFHPEKSVREQTPRRLVYCLPMRTLVNQTVEISRQWVDELNNVEILNKRIPVSTLMGGEYHALSGRSWDAFPEREQILVGTQDQLLSRALNRGYTMSRYRWPVHFALLNNDALWIMDEIQLMGNGLITSLQLDGFRHFWKTAKTCHTIWMSATISKKALVSVDHPSELIQRKITIDPSDINPDSMIGRRIYAPKPITRCEITLNKHNKNSYDKLLAAFILEKVRPKPSETTLVIVNQVHRAIKVYERLRAGLKRLENAPDCLLIHSRFRQIDRKSTEYAIQNEAGQSGRIIVSTQVVEAGLDLDANYLVTEIAPWSSLVQRFGRCNRRGRLMSDEAKIFWIDIENELKYEILPYSSEELTASTDRLNKTVDAGICHIHSITMPDSIHVPMVIRKREFKELFDTTPDLAGWDIDVSRYIREDDEHDVNVFWRNLDEYINETGSKVLPDTIPSPVQEEMCSVPIGEFRKHLKKLKSESKFRNSAWIWNPLDRCWSPLQSENLRPGLVILINHHSGGYEKETGWNGALKTVEPVIQDNKDLPEAMGEDLTSTSKFWQTISSHTSCVMEVMNDLIDQDLMHSNTIMPEWIDALRNAVKWHDAGKAHPAFQNRLTLDYEPPEKNQLWAKSPRSSHPGLYPADPGNPKSSRKYFRHELVSALTALHNRCPDLTAYLVAAHHGKIRMVIRPIAGEIIPSDNRRFALGVWDKDVIPEINLDSNLVVKPFIVNLDIMEIGETENGPGWTHRMQVLVDTLGPFRLSWIEYMLRVADWRGSNMKESCNG